MTYAQYVSCITVNVKSSSSCPMCAFNLITASTVLGSSLILCNSVQIYVCLSTKIFLPHLTGNGSADFDEIWQIGLSWAVVERLGSVPDLIITSNVQMAIFLIQWCLKRYTSSCIVSTLCTSVSLLFEVLL